MNQNGTGRHRWGTLLLSCLVLMGPLQPGPWTQASAVTLRQFIGCAVREFTFLARKPGCGGLHITTDACWGRCETWEVKEMGVRYCTKPVLEPPFIESHQRVCTYNQTRLLSVRLPNCSSGVDPAYTFPLALRCHCAVCAASSTECITAV